MRVHLVYRARKAEQHDAAVATAVCRDTITLTHPKAEVANEDNDEHQKDYSHDRCDTVEPHTNIEEKIRTKFLDVVLAARETSQETNGSQPETKTTVDDRDDNEQEGV